MSCCLLSSHFPSSLDLLLSLSFPLLLTSPQLNLSFFYHPFISLTSFLSPILLFHFHLLSPLILLPLVSSPLLSSHLLFSSPIFSSLLISSSSISFPLIYFNLPYYTLVTLHSLLSSLIPSSPILTEKNL